MYAYDSNNGIIKFSIKEEDYGKILVHNPSFKYTPMSIVYIDGKLFLRDQLQRTRDSKKNVVPYLLLDPATLQVINNKGELEPIASSTNSDDEGSALEEEEETGPAQGESLHSLDFTKPNSHPVPKAGRYRIYTPLFTDSVFLYTLTLEQQKHDETLVAAHDSYGSDDEGMFKEPSVYLE